MSERIIRSYETAPGCFRITVEVTDAYTDGSSRFDQVYVARDELRGKTRAERLQAVFDAVDDDPMGDLAGEIVSAPVATKEILERRAEAKYADWQRWKVTREEAEKRALAKPVVAALTAREDAAWTAYLADLNDWRSRG